MQRWVLAAQPCACALLIACAAFGYPASALAQSQADTSSTELAQLSVSDPEVVPVLRQAESLLAEKKAAAAYALLETHELDLAGTPLYDYLLGLAALDSGHANDAAFALERVVSIQPDFAGARIELARAQFERGELALS